MMNRVTEAPLLSRIRYETWRWVPWVLSARRLKLVMLRLRLGGEDLAGFTPLSPSDRVNLFIPDGADGTAMRHYAPRRYYMVEGRLEIDLALDDAGPATRWAMQARPGDRVEIGGPRGSLVIGGAVAEWLLIGDEIALPSIARRIEEMAPGVSVTSIVAIADAADRKEIRIRADHCAIQVPRKDLVDAAPAQSALDQQTLHAGTFVWIAAEVEVAPVLRDAVQARGVLPNGLRAAGYRVAGTVDAPTKYLWA